MSLRPAAAVLASAFTLLLTVQPAALRAQNADEAAVIAVIEGFHQALASGDSTKALGHLAEDVTILESGGVENKEHYRTGHLSGDMRFAAAVPSERGDIQVTVRGDVAWAYSTSVTEGKMGDREINSRGAELAVLARDGGSWKIEAIHWSSRRMRSR
jgi:ketosteroid isomerase-like protein